jgi:hypothetical protein
LGKKKFKISIVKKLNSKKVYLLFIFYFKNLKKNAPSLKKNY